VLPISKVIVPSVLLRDSGIVAMRSDNFLAVVKASDRKFRPSHADCLHLDLFHENRNLLRDAGSYSYQDRGWHHYFSGTSSHNTIQFDEHDQMPRLSKFMFAKWLKNARVDEISVDETGQAWAGAYVDSWGNSHERAVRINRKELIVVDRINGNFSTATLRWRLNPGEWKVENNLASMIGVSIEVTCADQCGSMELVSGWDARYYQKKYLIPVLQVNYSAGAHEIKTRVSIE
jgi:hypothetical protein